MASNVILLPRVIRLRDAAAYLGMDKNRFDREVRPSLTEFPIGEQGVGFDRLDLDDWFEEYKARNGRPGKATEGGKPWDRKSRQDSSRGSGVWHVQKTIGNGRRLRESTGTSDLTEAERYLAHRIEEIRNAEIYGIRPKRTFREAATKYLQETEKASLAKDAWCLERIDPFIGDLYLENVHMGTLRPYIEHGREEGLEKPNHQHADGSGEAHLESRGRRMVGRKWPDMASVRPKDSLVAQNRCDGALSSVLGGARKALQRSSSASPMMCLFAVNTGCQEYERSVACAGMTKSRFLSLARASSSFRRNG